MEASRASEIISDLSRSAYSALSAHFEQSSHGRSEFHKLGVCVKLVESTGTTLASFIRPHEQAGLLSTTVVNSVSTELTEFESMIEQILYRFQRRRMEHERLTHKHQQLLWSSKEIGFFELTFSRLNVKLSLVQAVVDLAYISER